MESKTNSKKLEFYRMIGILLLLGIFIPLSTSQQLTTKCPSSDWTQYYEKCYLAVNYTLSWSSSINYCQKYGAKLVEPRGYTLNDVIHDEVTSRMPTVSSYWTGYHRITDDSLSPTSGFWSDGVSAGVEVGVWGHGQPDVTAGDCAYVSYTDRFWYMTSCNSLMSFVCELDPCPAGDRDTFMCNGKCLGQGYLCDGDDDCGNNYDEQNCASTRCSQTLKSNSGTITLDTNSGLYSANQHCTWLIETQPGTRVNMTISSLNTESNIDFLEIWDGGLSMSDSTLAARLSGDMTNYIYTSSLNFVFLRFISDESIQDLGFSLSWTTEYTCGYRELMNYNLTNIQVINETLALSSLANNVKCRAECNDRTDCVGFSFDISNKICYFMKMLDILSEVQGSAVYIKTCPSYGMVKGSVHIWDEVLSASPSPQDLTTPLYPMHYIGNTELEYQIIASANNRITLEVLFVELCCGDVVTIHDENRALLYTLDSDSVPIVLVSTSSMMYVRKSLHTHNKCRGVLMRYREGCDISLTGSGQFSSPGYGSSVGYGPLTVCTWTLQAQDGNSGVSLLFEDFSLQSSDSVMLTHLGSSTTYTNQELDGASITSDGTVVVTMVTSARDGGRGFTASFSAGCSSLDSGGYSSSGSSNYGDTVTLECAQGFYFVGDYADQTSVTMSCGLGGLWSLDPIPVCQRAYCGPPPLINNGFIMYSSGSQGGHMTEYACNMGFSMSGSSIISCLANDTWETVPTCSAASCADLSQTLADPINATVLYGSGTDYNSVVQLSCPQYMEVIGAATVSCQDGTFGFTADTNPSYCQVIPCETPVIDNAFLTPAPPYYKNQEISVTCMEGYDQTGDSPFRCDVDTDWPACVKKTCSLAGLTNILPVNDNRTVYNYGERVEVMCTSDLMLTTPAIIECLSTGSWSSVPECKNTSCGIPYPVAGSIYIPDPPCQEYGCSFNFTCDSQYELFGASIQGDHIVRCGLENTGVWDFGNLHCLGGQCPDPGYPPSGYLIGDSFEEGALVTFACNGVGFSALNADGSESAGLVCSRDPINNELYWAGEMPQCKDVQPPVFTNCPTQTVEIDYLQAPGFTVPTAFDNNGLQEVEIIPDNFDPTIPRGDREEVYYIARDFAGNSRWCNFDIEITDYIECRNDITTAYPISTSTLTLYGNNSDYYRQVMFDDNITVTFEPEFITVEPNLETLQNFYEIEVIARNTTTNQELERNTLQFRFEAPACASWSLYVPNGFGNCVNGVCNTSCVENAYFMENPAAANILVNCVNGAWNREPPVCAMSTTNYVIYTVEYGIKYFISEGVVQFSDCSTHYQAGIEDILIEFAAEMQTECNRDSNGENDAVVAFYNTSPLQYSNGDLRLQVYFEFQINVTNENMTNSQTVKENCVNTISNFLSNPAYIDDEPLFLLLGNENCGNGTYDYPIGPAAFSYKCIGSRKFVNGDRVCLTCPTGFYYNEMGGNCTKCPRNTYGVQTDLGAMCQACPNGNGPDKTGLTDVDQCYWKATCGPGYYSEDGLTTDSCTLCPRNFYNPQNVSRICQKCSETEITMREGSNSSADCVTQAEAEDLVTNDSDYFGVSTPCLPNPCSNNAVCTYVYNKYYCACPTGYTGRLCETEFTACNSKPCENDQQCIPGNDGTYTCNCGQPGSEFSGDQCQFDVSNLNPDLCLNNGTVHNKKGGHTCMCPSYSGYSNINTGNCGTAINQCSADPCDQGECFPHGSFYRSCRCNPGFTGFDCSQNIDDCDPNLCENEGNCTDQIDGFTCQCPTGFHGNYCQFVTACDAACTNGPETGCNTCDIDGTEMCENIGNSYMCHCKQDYIGTSCEIEVSPCNSYPCQHAGTCTELTDSSYMCECRAPWTGDNCEVEVDYCETGDECLNGGTCYSSASGYICSCPSDYIGGNCSEDYDLCQRANPCVGDNSVCSFSDGGFACACDQDYTGDSCQTKIPSCTDIICNNGGTCSDSSGTPTCTCVAGYNGANCQNNINECASNPCDNGEVCQDGVNSFTCICGPTKRGENCEKDFDADFDYIITPSSMCREEVSQSTFGNGQPIEALTISFWVRYRVLHGAGTILSVYATSQQVDLIPESPELKIKFDSTHMVAEYTSPSRRKKRQTTSASDFTYPSTIADGYWWHIALVWASDPGELTLYVNGNFVDQEFFAQGSNLGTRGFVVLGDYDPLSGTTNTANGFEGRLSQLFIVNQNLGPSDIQQLYERTLIPNGLILYPQRTTMLYYPVDYNSELNPNNQVCLSRTDTGCDINAGTSFPEILTCPGDALSVTARLEAPTWTAPTFAADASFVSTLSSGTLIEWGLYGVSYAVFNSQNNSAVCTFRVYNREAACSASQGSASCTVTNGVHICQDDCSSSQEWPGVVPRYLTCSMYGMWDEAVRSTSYIQPRCSTSTDINNDVTVVISGTTSESCEAMKAGYMTSIQNKLNAFNSDTGNQLCPTSNCNSLVTATTVKCLNDATIQVSLNFGVISSTMPYQGTTVSVEEALQIATGDSQVFAYASTANSNQTVDPDISSLDITSSPTCGSQTQISGNKCVSCGPGTSYDEATSTCVRCPIGTYKDSLVSTCTACHTSRTTASTGSTSVDYCKTSCFAGQYYDEQDLQGCRDCPVGFYQTSTGQFSCLPCLVTHTTAGTGSRNASSCVTFSSLETTTAPLSPIGAGAAFASTEDTGLETGVIVAIVLGVVIFLLIVILILVFCCCKGAFPCLAKKKQVVSPVGKDSYYANKYGELDMRFVSYNLKDVREKKGRPLDREPIVEPALSEETGSLKTDISIHVPVFTEKMNGSVTRKSMYVSNGGQNLNASLTRSMKSSARDPTSSRDQMTPQIIAPMTSSPRSMSQYYYDENTEEHKRRSRSKKKRRRGHKHRSSHHYDNQDDATYENVDLPQHSLPKALSPIPQKVKSKPPADVFMRPASPMNRPRAEVLPSEYQDFLEPSPERSPVRSPVRSGGQRSQAPKVPRVQRVETPTSPDGMMRIEVESDEDLR